MSFEEQITESIVTAVKQECAKIADRHIEKACAEMRERSNKMLAEIGLKLISQVSYRDNMNNIRVELTIPDK